MCMLNVIKFEDKTMYKIDINRDISTINYQVINMQVAISATLLPSSFW